MDGEFNPVDLEGPKRIFSGHFHLRSSKANVYYIGNCETTIYNTLCMLSLRLSNNFAIFVRLRRTNYVELFARSRNSLCQ